MGHALRKNTRQGKRRRKQHWYARVSVGARRTRKAAQIRAHSAISRTKRAGGSCTDPTHRFRDSPFGGAGAGMAARSRFLNDAFRFPHMLKIMNGPRGA